VSLEELYQEIILEHWETPLNKGALGEEATSVHLRNPLCGDEVKLFLILKGDTVDNVSFEGHGCSISQAAASMMTQLVKGKKRDEVEQVIEKYRRLLKGELDEKGKEELGDISVLETVKRFPSRIRCALLSFEALEQLMNEKPQ
jgi:nitrogen fixation NifU-like protein